MCCLRMNQTSRNSSAILTGASLSLKALECTCKDPIDELALAEVVIGWLGKIDV